MNKKLYRSTKNKMVAGVCGGLAEYFDVDPTIVRVVFLISLFLHGAGVIAYIVLWIAVPQQSYVYNMASSTSNEPVSDSGQNIPNPVTSYQETIDKRKQNRSVIGGVLLILLGLFFLADEIFPRIDFGDFFSIALIIFGIVLLINSSKKN